MAGQLWSVNTLGGYLSAFRLSKILREAVKPMFRWRQFCDVKDETANEKKKGDTFHWDIVFELEDDMRAVAETETTPETQFRISQGTGTITEAVLAVPYTGKLEALAELDIRKPIMSRLANKTQKYLDKSAFDEFASSNARVCGTAEGTNVFTYTGTTASTNDIGLKRKNVDNIRDTMAERNVPGYEGDTYMCVAHPTTLRDLKEDLLTVNQYTETGYQRIFNGEIGRYGGVRFVEQTSVAKNTVGTWATNAHSNWAIFFGEETVIEGIAVPEEVRAKISQDYGRDKGVASYYLGGFKIVHNWSAAEDPGSTQSRIFVWDSAA